MARIRRSLFNAITVLSVLSALAALTLGVRSLFIRDDFHHMAWNEHAHGVSRWWLQCWRGQVTALRIFTPSDRDPFLENPREFRLPPGVWIHVSVRDAAPIWDIRWLPVYLASEGSASPDQMWRITLPLWMVVLVAAVLPCTRTLSALKYRRGRKLGLCPTCGYDLRATPDRCPECGYPCSNAGSPPSNAPAHAHP
jgi:hypothetical protein